MNKLYPNSTSEGQNDCAFPRYLLYFHGTFYTHLAERGQTDNISSHWSHARSRGNRLRPFFKEYHMLRAIERCDQILLFSRFLLLTSLRQLLWWKNNLQRVDWAYFFGKFCSGSLFLAQTKKTLTCPPCFLVLLVQGACGIFGSSLSEKNVTQLADFKTKLLLRTKVSRRLFR